MSFEAAANLIRARFATEMASREPTVELAYLAVKFTPTKGQAYVRLSILPGGKGQAALGSNPTVRADLVAVAQIFVPTNNGTSECYGIADTLTDIFQFWKSGTTKQFQDITTGTISDREADWFQLNVNIPFISDAVV